MLRPFMLLMVAGLTPALAGGQQAPTGDTIRFRIQARTGATIRYVTQTRDSGEARGGDPEDPDAAPSALFSAVTMGMMHLGTFRSEHTITCRAVEPDGSSSWEMRFLRLGGTSVVPGVMEISYDMKAPRVEARALGPEGLPDPGGVSALTEHLRQSLIALRSARLAVTMSPGGRIASLGGTRELAVALGVTPFGVGPEYPGSEAEAADSALAYLGDRLVGRLYHAGAPGQGVTAGDSWERTDTVRAPSGMVLAIHATRSTLDSARSGTAWVTTRITLTSNLAGAMMADAREKARAAGQPIDEAELERAFGDVTRVREGVSVVAVSLRDGLPISSSSRETTTTFLGAVLQGLTLIQVSREEVVRAK